MKRNKSAKRKANQSTGYGLHRNVAAVIVLLAGGCSAGSVDESPDAEGALPVVTSVDADGNACTVQTGQGVLRRLTKAEYRASLVSLFGRADVPEAEPLSGNTQEDAFSTRADGLWVRDLSAQALSNHADTIAAWALATDPALVSGCTELSEECARQTISGFGRRAFRAPLSDVQLTRYLNLFLAGDSFDDGASRVVSAMIQSPYFLYRRELGVAGDGAVRLSDYELASALSYIVTGAPPDPELSAVADAGSLREDSEWERQLTRLLQSPQAEEQIVGFVVEWLGLDLVLTKTKNEAGVELSESLRQAMFQEVHELVRHVYSTGGGFRELLFNESVFVNPELAEHYGLADPGADAFVAQASGDRVGGVLGTGSFLLGHSTVDSSSPTARGIYIRERILCEHVPPPPPSVDTDLPVIDGPQTTRDRFTSHLADPTCASCHHLIDNYGYAFESFDGLGRYRTEEAGIPVDSSGVAVALDAQDQSYTDAAQLLGLLQGSQQVERCFHQQFLEFSAGQEDWDNQCSVNALVSSTQSGDGTLQGAVRSILSLPHFEARLAQGTL